MEKCYIVSYGRSPIAKAGKGSLANSNPIDFGAEVLNGVLNKVKNLDKTTIDDLILGCAIPEGMMGLNPGKNLALRAELPHEVPGFTINRFCSSGLQSIAIAAAMINSGMQDIVVAGGLESMSQPVLSENKDFLNEWLLKNTDAYMSMGMTAENVASKYKLNREELDEFAVISTDRAINAIDNGLFKKEIIPVKVNEGAENEFEFAVDECPRRGTTMEGLAKLNPCFKEDGVMTAGNSSQRSDGAGFVVLMSETKVNEMGIKPIGVFHGFAVAGIDPALMGLGPIPATQKLMKKLNFSIKDLDVIEINEAFASQSIACIRDLGISMAKVNPRGGAISLGHPLGATGAILTSKALSFLEDESKKYGLITMCIGGGMGAAGLIENLLI